MCNFVWTKDTLTSQKIGAIGEYYAKMTFLSYGLNVYTSEIDDHGIDFVIEVSNRFLKIQVKTVRAKTDYVYMRKKYFNPSDISFYVCFIRLTDGEYPALYLIPASAWVESNQSIFVYRPYEGRKSAPEYGLNLSKKNLPQLEKYKFETVIKTILHSAQNNPPSSPL